jgi:FAD/FMN-containing dehydrogenase
MAWVALDNPDAAVALLNLALARAGTGLTAFELLGRRPLEFTVRHVPGTVVPLPLDWPWHVMMEVSSGRSPEEARQLTEEILVSALDAGIAGDAVVAQSLAQGASFWTIRETLPEAQLFEGASIKHDISVPVAAIPEFIGRGEPLVEAVCPGARVVCFGHMGDGNLHYNVSRPVDGSDADFLGRYRAVNAAVHGLVRELGGSISAEHGIGQLKRDELLATAPAVGIDLMRRVKAAFDPVGIMNPGKVI